MPREPYQADQNAIGQKKDDLSRLDEKPMRSLGGKEAESPPYLPHSRWIVPEKP